MFKFFDVEENEFRGMIPYIHTVRVSALTFKNICLPNLTDFFSTQIWNFENLPFWKFTSKFSFKRQNYVKHVIKIKFFSSNDDTQGRFTLCCANTQTFLLRQVLLVAIAVAEAPPEIADEQFLSHQNFPFFYQNVIQNVKI